MTLWSQAEARAKDVSNSVSIIPRRLKVHPSFKTLNFASLFSSPGALVQFLFRVGVHGLGLVEQLFQLFNVDLVVGALGLQLPGPSQDVIGIATCFVTTRDIVTRLVTLVIQAISLIRKGGRGNLQIPFSGSRWQDRCGQLGLSRHGSFTWTKKILTYVGQIDGHLSKPGLGCPRFTLQKSESTTERKDVLLADGQELFLLLQLVLGGDELVEGVVVRGLHHGSLLANVSGR